MQPLAERLRYGTQLHEFIVEMIKNRRDFSQEKMRERWEHWKRADEQFISYMPEKSADALRRKLRENKGEPQFTTVYIPYDYATLMSAHTYWTSVFLSRNPILQYMGTSGQPESAVKAVESLMDYQVYAGRALPNVYVWLLDVGKYGVGILGTYWADEQSVVSQEVEVPDVWMGVDLGTTKREMRAVTVPGYQGNRNYNIRPYDFLPDPRVTMMNFQDGEFAGRITQLSWNQIIKAWSQQRYFNVDVLRNQRSTNTNGDRFPGSAQVPQPFMPDQSAIYDLKNTANVNILEMCIELIPWDWQLGESKYPEKWVFTLANDAILIGAQPLGLAHNKFPYEVLEFEPDGYAMFKRGLLDLAAPMNNVINWLINTHFYNTRKSLNDMWVVDPSRVVMKDVLDPEPGKTIRLREEFYGTDVRTAITQFPSQNVTQQHLNDTQMIAMFLQRVTGVNDSIMGMLGGGGRKTATEVRTSSTFGINRLKTVAEYFSATGFSGWSQLMLQQTQQLMTQERKVRIAGEAWLTPGAAKFLTVSPRDIQGMFDFIPVDGTLPVDRFAQVNMWSSLLQQISSSPQILQQYDIGRIFAWVAQLGGLRNVEQFKIQAVDPAVLLKQAQAGNIIPMRTPNGQPGSAPRTEGESPTPSQLPGMGPSG